MSVRVEWVKATDVGILLHERGMLADDGQPVDEDYGLQIGSLMIEGTAADLEDTLRWGLAILRGEEQA